MATPRRNLLVAAALCALFVASSAAFAQSLSERREDLDSRISAVRGEIASARHKEGVLSSEVAAVTADMRALGSDIAVLSAKVEELEGQLARLRARLAELVARYEYQTKHLERLRRDHAIAERALEERLVELYQTDPADPVAIFLQVQSLGELIERIDFANDVGRQDRRISATLKRLKIAMREARERTARLRDEVEEATAVVADKTSEARSARATLVARQEALAAARAEKSGLLASVREERHDHEEDLGSMLAASASLADQIRAAQAAAAAAAAAEAAQAAEAAESSSGGSSGGGGGGSSGPSDTTASSSGLIWPVSGVLTSGFGYRWGRMHEGIDISAPTGTAVHAAASGRVIVAGSMGGYGLIVVIDHGNGLSTAYAHLSSIWISGGSVAQGQAIGAVGCTGSCTGPHLHFEVRVNGTPVNPLSYL